MFRRTAHLIATLLIALAAGCGESSAPNKQPNAEPVGTQPGLGKNAPNVKGGGARPNPPAPPPIEPIR